MKSTKIEKVVIEKRILIVDDELISLSTLSCQFQSRGWNVTIAENGSEAFEIIEAQAHDNPPFHFLLTDIKMPVMTGIELVKKMNKHGISIPTGVMSGSFRESEKKQLNEYGCCHFFEKPIRITLLVQLINKHFKNGILRGKGRASRNFKFSLIPKYRFPFPSSDT